METNFFTSFEGYIRPFFLKKGPKLDRVRRHVHGSAQTAATLRRVERRRVLRSLDRSLAESIRKEGGPFFRGRRGQRFLRDSDRKDQAFIKYLLKGKNRSFMLLLLLMPFAEAALFLDGNTLPLLKP